MLCFPPPGLEGQPIYFVGPTTCRIFGQPLFFSFWGGYLKHTQLHSYEGHLADSNTNPHLQWCPIFLGFVSSSATRALGPHVGHLDILKIDLQIIPGLPVGSLAKIGTMSKVSILVSVQMVPTFAVSTKDACLKAWRPPQISCHHAVLPMLPFPTLVLEEPWSPDTPDVHMSLTMTPCHKSPL